MWNRSNSLIRILTFFDRDVLREFGATFVAEAQGHRVVHGLFVTWFEGI